MMPHARWLQLAIHLVVTLWLLWPVGAHADTDTWRDDLGPIRAEDWSAAHAAHLLERAGFGGTPGEIAALSAGSRQPGIRRSGPR